MAINARYKKFVNLYIKSFNATQAAIDCGYSKKRAAQTGSDILKRPEVKEYMRQRMTEQDARMVADTNECLTFLSAVLRGEVKDAFGLDAALSDRLKAAEALLKRYEAAGVSGTKELHVKYLPLENEDTEGWNE